MTHFAAVLLAAVCAASCCFLTASAASANAAAPDLSATLDAVERAVAYMGRHAKSANLDGGIGLRTVEGQFGALLARHWTRLPIWLVTRLRSIQFEAGRVAKEMSDSVRKTTPSYFSNAGQLLDSHAWDIFFPNRRLPLASRPALLREAARVARAGRADADDDGFDEKFSDDCIREFYGAGGQPRCSISSGCWNTLVRSEGRKDYFLTHQVFYLLSGINANCLYNLTVMARSQSSSPEANVDDHPLRRLFDRFCGRVLVAASEQEAEGFPAINRDLFMEQIGLCGLAGYTSEFGQARWRGPVLSWQRANGCYGAFPNEPIASENFNPKRYGNYRRRRRRKRSEALMAGDGCLSHRTSVALDALVAFTRQQVESLL